uniref:Uncharacterized protein n=1 Tax=Anguilla anguilla TaxID=7936 RepID=A0A0E9Y2K2_ANGAN
MFLRNCKCTVNIYQIFSLSYVFPNLTFYVPNSNTHYKFSQKAFFPVKI